MSLKKIIFGIVAMTVVLLWGTGCYYDVTVPVIKEETKEISFSGDLIPIFNASCNTSGCHNAGGTPPVLTASEAYDNLINGGYIDLSAPESSELYRWLTGKESTPMPLTGPDPDINAKVLAWIKQGASNN
jgi:hypothetical protein